MPLVLIPAGNPGGHPSQLEIRCSWAPVKPPRGQTLRPPRQKVTSVLTRSTRFAVLRGISNTVGRGFENTVPFWRTLRHQATKGYMSQRMVRQKSQTYNPQETAQPHSRFLWHVQDSPMENLSRCVRSESVGVLFRNPAGPWIKSEMQRGIWPCATWEGAATRRSFYAPRQRVWARVGDWEWDGVWAGAWEGIWDVYDVWLQPCRLNPST